MPHPPHIIASLRQRKKRESGNDPFPPSADPFAPMKPPRGRPDEIDQRLDDLLRSYTLQQIAEDMQQKVIEVHGNSRRTARKIRERAKERLGALKP
jgi:hypothetical protein